MTITPKVDIVVSFMHLTSDDGKLDLLHCYINSDIVAIGYGVEYAKSLIMDDAPNVKFDSYIWYLNDKNESESIFNGKLHENKEEIVKVLNMITFRWAADKNLKNRMEEFLKDRMEKCKV